jgi:hypothetical protein
LTQPLGQGLFDCMTGVGLAEAQSCVTCPPQDI